MATTLRTAISCAAALAVLGACGAHGAGGSGNEAKGGTAPPAAQASLLFPDNFKGVCSGASVSAATAYDARAAAHKALYFATYKDDFTDRSSALPRDWTILFSPDKDALRAVDLVVCAKRTAAREVKLCDKYQKEGSATQNKVRWHTATYALSVHEAKTGKTLAETSVEATDADCPMFMSFTGETDIVGGYASPSDSAVTDFLRPHVAH